MVVGGDCGHADARNYPVAVGDLLTFVDFEPKVLSADGRLMTEESVTSTSGTKKKSFFQITKVEKVETGTVEEDGDDGDEDGDDVDDEDGDEEDITEKRESAAGSSAEEVAVSLKPPLDVRIQASSLQSASTSSLANGASSSGTASKFRVVRITKNTLNKKYTRGRWHCWDYSDPEVTQHSPIDHENDTSIGETPCRREQCSQDIRSSYSTAEPTSHGVNRACSTKAETPRRACEEHAVAAAVSDLSNPLAEIGKTSSIGRQTGDGQVRPLVNEERR